MKRHEVKKKYEDHAVDDALEMLNQYWINDFRVVERPDPPEAILKDGVGKFCWIEHVCAYRSKDEAHECWSYATPGEKPHVREEALIVDPDERIVHSIIANMKNKFGKSSYKGCVERFGPGKLLVSVFDPLFTEHTLELLKQRLQSEFFSDQVNFSEVYLRFRLSFWTRNGLVKIYPVWGEYIVDFEHAQCNLPQSIMVRVFRVLCCWIFVAVILLTL